MRAQAQHARSLRHQRRPFSLHPGVFNLRSAQCFGEKPANVRYDAARATFQYVLKALLVRPDVGESVLGEVVPHAPLQLSESLRVIRQFADISQLGKTREAAAQSSPSAFTMPFTLR